MIKPYKISVPKSTLNNIYKKVRSYPWKMMQNVNGEDAIKASAKEWYVPTEAEMTKWRAGAIGAWLDAKGTFEPEVAKRVLLEQGMDGFVAQLEKAGAL